MGWSYLRRFNQEGLSMRRVLLSILLGGFIATTSRADEAASLARSVGMAYDSNRLSFPHGRLEFRFSVGSTSSLERAVEGKWEDRYAADGSYAYADERAIYDCVFTAEDMINARKKSGDGWISPIDSWRVLTNGKLTLIDQVFVASSDDPRVTRNVQIVDGSSEFFGHVICPLNLGDPGRGSFDLAKDVENATGGTDGDFRLLAVEDSEFDGRDVVHLATGFKENRRDYWVDIERGAIPLRIEDSESGESGNPVVQVAYDDIRPVGDGRWLPHLMTIRFDHGMTKQVAIVRAEFDAGPARSTFRLSFPEPVRLVNTASMVVYDAQQEWDLDALPGPSSPRSHPIAISEPGPPLPEMPGERDPFPVRPLVAITLGILLIAGSAWIYHRRRGEDA